MKALTIGSVNKVFFGDKKCFDFKLDVAHHSEWEYFLAKSQILSEECFKNVVCLDKKPRDDAKLVYKELKNSIAHNLTLGILINLFSTL